MERFAEFFINHWDLFAALAIILAMLVGGPLVRRLRGYHEVEPLQAVQLLNHESAQLVDVRELNEFRDGHIAGSHHLPLSRFTADLAKLESWRDTPLVVGCRSGSRSARACGILKQRGFTTVYNLKGGVMAWQSAGLPLQREEKKSRNRRRK